MLRRFGFYKKERLKSRKRIAALFKQKQSVGAFPLRFFFMEVSPEEQSVGLQVSFSVSKKYFKRAVDRNRLKRLMREAYRLEKQRILEKLQQEKRCLCGMWVFVGQELFSFNEVHKAMRKSLERLSQSLG